MDHRSQLAALIRHDAARWHALGCVRALGLDDGWIAAGFVRDAVWDHLHDRAPRPPTGDVDVIWFDVMRTDRDLDRALERALAASAPGYRWSVKNQARMHLRNGDSPYRSAADAMRYWPETATAVAIRRTAGNACEIAAPFGLDDLFGLRLVPTAGFVPHKRAIFDRRVAEKSWLTRYPRLRDPAA